MARSAATRRSGAMISKLAVAAAGLASIAAGPVKAEPIQVAELDSAPTLDGSLLDWAGVEPVAVGLSNSKPDGSSDVSSISLRVGVQGDDVYFALQWTDDSEDIEHAPFEWDESSGRYKKGPQREDRLALQFEMDGDYSADWASGNAFTADIWHWKAARTNPIGLAHDKMTVVTRQETKKAFKLEASDGSTVYISRPSDEGSKLYTSLRYGKKFEDRMPKYELAQAPSGSIADVQAKGVWADGTWTLELKRKLDTGHADDVVFVRGQAVDAAIAVFNHTGDDDHNISGTLSLAF